MVTGSGGEPQPPLRKLAITAAKLAGGLFALSLLPSFTAGIIRGLTESQLKKTGMECRVCKGKGFYICKLCKGNSTIEWSPLYDPVVVNPCLCPTCDGNRIQRCLNCLGKGYN